MKTLLLVFAVVFTLALPRNSNAQDQSGSDLLMCPVVNGWRVSGTNLPHLKRHDTGMQIVTDSASPEGAHYQTFWFKVKQTDDSIPYLYYVEWEKKFPPINSFYFFAIEINQRLFDFVGYLPQVRIEIFLLNKDTTIRVIKWDYDVFCISCTKNCFPGKWCRHWKYIQSGKSLIFNKIKIRIYKSPEENNARIGFDNLIFWYGPCMWCMSYIPPTPVLFDGFGDPPDITTNVAERIDKLPYDFELHQNYPNPFNSITVIPYELKERGWVKLEVYNILGQKIITLVNEEKEAGFQVTYWDANGLSSGMYIARLSVNGLVKNQKLHLLK
ncbi:MAG: T9SS type A sorting domain-containing protein [Patescibacteria group bacterium]